MSIYKGTPTLTMRFSMAVSNILKHLNVKFYGINVLDDQNLRQGIKDFSDWPTYYNCILKVNLLYYDIVKDMFER